MLLFDFLLSMLIGYLFTMAAYFAYEKVKRLNCRHWYVVVKPSYYDELYVWHKSISKCKYCGKQREGY